MRIVLTISMVLAMLLGGPLTVHARGHHHGSTHGQTPGTAAGKKKRKSVAGKFDYYVLSLSWSPEHCAEKPGGPDDPQCGTTRHYSFIVHGLWPQYENGGYPQTCATKNKLSESVIAATLPDMPSRDLIQHEWAKHGTCSGLPADAYFQDARDAFHRLTVPARYQGPEDAFHVTAEEVRQEFRTANPDVHDDGIAVLCNGHFFTELRVCLTKDDLTLRSCGRKVTDNCKGQVTVRPIR